MTDETGQASTELANHSWKTNKNDEVTDESNYSPSFGIWFGESDPDDTKGALTYDTYTLEELPCSGQLWERPFGSGRYSSEGSVG